MSKTNDPSGTALKTLAHPRLAWFIRKLAILNVIAQYRQSAQLHARYKDSEYYQLFRYEDLLAAPEQVLRDLCAFSGIDFVPEMLEPEKGHHDHQPSSLTGKRKKSFDPQAALRWQTTITRIERWLVSSLTRKSMKTLGYDPGSHPIFKANLEVV